MLPVFIHAPIVRRPCVELPYLHPLCVSLGVARVSLFAEFDSRVRSAHEPQVKHEEANEHNVEERSKHPAKDDEKVREALTSYRKRAQSAGPCTRRM